MKNVKRITLGVLAFFSVASFAVGLIGCDNSSTSNSASESGADTEHTHVWKADEILKRATCEEEGVMQYVCDCGETKTEPMEKSSHMYDVGNVGWEWNGYETATLFTLCYTCEQNLPIRATITTEEKEKATCTQDGKKVHTATVTLSFEAEGKTVKETFTDSKEETVSAQGHDYEDNVCVSCGHSCISTGLEYALNEDGQSYTVTGIGTCEDTELYIPGTYEGLPVTKIGDDAFYGNSSLTAVYIAEGITEIGGAAFYDDYKIKHIEVPSSIEKVGSNAFRGIGGAGVYNNYEGLRYLGNKDNPYLVLISASAGYGGFDSEAGTLHEETKVIYREAFKDWQNLKKITIPSKVTDIGACAFENCRQLRSITVPESVLRVQSHAFRDCVALKDIVIESENTALGTAPFFNCMSVENVTVPFGENLKAFYKLFDDNLNSSSGEKSPSSVCVTVTGKVITNNAFNMQNNMNFTNFVTSVKISNEITSIGENAFYSCSLPYNEKDGAYYLGNDTNPYVALIKADKEITALELPETVKVVYQEAFVGCTALKTVALPEGLTQIGKQAFGGCNELKSVEIPDGVTEIQASTFANCSSLESITIPGNVTKIGRMAFSGARIGNIYYTGDVATWCAISFENGEANPLAVAEHLYIKNNQTTVIEIPDTVTEIKEYAFYGFTHLRELSIGKNVTSIGAYAFANCLELEEINFAGTVEEWNAIPKDDTWNEGVGHLIEVVCSNDIVRY